MRKHIRIDEWMVAMLAASFAATGCGALRPLQVDVARTGETVVRVRAPRTFDQLAVAVYGDPSLGPALAELAALPYDERIAPGELLILPPREDMETRLTLARTAETQFAEGLAAADRGAYRSAADAFRAALNAAPHRIDIRYNLGLALLKAGDAPAATPVLEEVARLRPGHVDSRYTFGSALRQRRAWDRALQEFRAVIRIDPRHAAAAYAIARTLEDRGDLGDAKRAYRQFGERFPEDPLAAAAAERLADLTRPADSEDPPRAGHLTP